MSWDRSIDWVLSRYFSNRAELTVVFQHDPASITELASLRKLWMPVQSMSPETLRNMIKDRRLKLGEFEGIEARFLAEKFRESGLLIESRNTSTVSYLPYDRTNNTALVIENDEESKRVAKEMIEAGVPVQDIEE